MFFVYLRDLEVPNIVQSNDLDFRKISSINSERITSEDERMPSVTALWRHWMRTTYICNLWGNAHLPDVYENLPLPTESGWVINKDETYSIDWDDPTRQQLLNLFSALPCKNITMTHYNRAKHAKPGQWM